MTRKMLLMIFTPLLLAACGTTGSTAGSGGYHNVAPTPTATLPAPTPSAIATPAPSTPAVAPAVVVAQQAGLGAILVNPQGRTLYYFVPERGGAIVCTGQCLAAWPPALTSSMSAVGGAGVTGQLAVVTRSAGEQLTYNRWPLYTFSADTAAGQANGQGVFGFGGKWFVATPGLQP